jgi:hypothetical protein
MDVGMAAGRIEIEMTVSEIFSGVVAVTATVTATGGNADAVIAIAIGTTRAGAAGSKISDTQITQIL